jgi:hypothetical protein
MTELSFGLTEMFGFLTIGFGMAAGIFYPLAAAMLIIKGFRSN